jgi:hypothetical protein
VFGLREIWSALGMLAAWSGHDIGGTIGLRVPCWQVL